MQKPTFDIMSKASNDEKQKKEQLFDHKKLLNNTKANFKTNMFENANDNASKRDISSEIDYSDHRSIATSVTLSIKSGRRSHRSNAGSDLTKDNLNKLGQLANGAKLPSDAKSIRSQLSKYSKRGNSLGPKKSKFNTLEQIPESHELNLVDNGMKCHV